MVQSEKIELVKQTSERFDRASAVVLVGYRGLTVAEMSELRRRLRESGGELKVVKNRLTRLSLAQAECDELNDLLTGPVAIAFGYEDPTAPAKTCSQFAKENSKLTIKGGLLEKRRIEFGKISALAKLPGRTELLTQMASTMLAPARQLATALNQAMAKVVYAMKDRASQLET